MCRPVRAVVVAHGDVDAADADLARGADLLIAADGGSAHLARWGLAPHLVIGDLDSLPPAAAQGGAHVERWPRDKDKSDTQLAVERAIAIGADEVTVLGALGGARADHAMANVLLLALGDLDRRVRIVRGPLSARVARSGETVTLAGGVGELVTLLALGGDASGISTTGLRFPLAGESLRLGSSRGLSNQISASGASVSVGSGALLVIETGALAGRSEPEPEP